MNRKMSWRWWIVMVAVPLLAGCQTNGGTAPDVQQSVQTFIKDFGLQVLAAFLL